MGSSRCRSDGHGSRHVDNGFNDLGDLGEEILHPEMVPRAIILGLLPLVVSICLKLSLHFLRTLPFAVLAHSQHVASDVRGSLLSRGAIWLTIAMAISALKFPRRRLKRGPHSLRYCRDGAFFQFTARIQPTFRLPAVPFSSSARIAALLALTGTYEDSYSLFVFAVWIFFALNAIALLRLCKKEPGLSWPYRLGLSLDAARLLAG